MAENGTAQMNALKFNERKVLVFKDIEKISDFVISKWIELAEKYIEEKGVFVVALSGGKTPIRLYQRLAHSKFNFSWEKIHIFLVDERFVPFESPESNYHILKENLLNSINIPEKNVHPIYIEETAKISAQRFETAIKDFFNLKEKELPKFDLIMLGVGEDGHTASLFPENDALSQRQHLAVAVDYEAIKFERITIALGIINNASNIIFLVSGKNKAHIVKDILEGNKNQLPAALVKPKEGKISFLLDEQSASLLKNIVRVPSTNKRGD